MRIERRMETGKPWREPQDGKRHRTWQGARTRKERCSEAEERCDESQGLDSMTLTLEVPSTFERQEEENAT